MNAAPVDVPLGRRAPTLADRLRYWVPTGAFCLLFVGSVILTFSDLEESRVATEGFGFPAWAVVPQGVAKALGLVAVLVPRWHTLTGLAFAGFLYDLLLAWGAHIAQRDAPNFALASLGLVLTSGAYLAYRRRYRSRPPARTW
jgi:hypothetical protein